MQELELQNKHNLQEVLEPILRLFYLLFHRKDMQSVNKLEIDSTPFRERLSGYINLHSSLLLDEFENYFNNHDEYIFCYDNNEIDKVDNSLRTHSQLELLYDIVGESELKKRINTVVRSVMLGYGHGINPNQFFLQDDILKLRENYYDDFWFKITDTKSKTSGRLAIQLLNNPKIFMKTNLSRGLLLRNNPEFIIRYYISENINPHEFFKFDRPLWDDDERDDFWDIPAKQDIKDYSFLKILTQMAEPDSSFHALWKFDNKFIDIKSRFKIFNDIIGQDIIKEKLISLEKSIQALSDDKLCNTPIFSQNDIVMLEEKPENMYVVRSQDVDTYDVTLFNIMDKDDNFILSQSQLLKENPQYFSRLQKQFERKK